MAETQTPEQNATAYIKRIKNAAKRKYAMSYLAYLYGTTHLEPDDPHNLSYMAAQAVRIELRRILGC